MLTVLLAIILAELLEQDLLFKTIKQIYRTASMNIYLIRCTTYDESSAISLKYFLKYSFSGVDFKNPKWVYFFIGQI